MDGYEGSKIYFDSTADIERGMNIEEEVKSAEVLLRYTTKYSQ